MNYIVFISTEDILLSINRGDETMITGPTGNRGYSPYNDLMAEREVHVAASKTGSVFDSRPRDSKGCLKPRYTPAEEIAGLAQLSGVQVRGRLKEGFLNGEIPPPRHSDAKGCQKSNVSREYEDKALQHHEKPTEEKHHASKATGNGGIEKTGGKHHVSKATGHGGTEKTEEKHHASKVKGHGVPTEAEADKKARKAGNTIALTGEVTAETKKQREQRLKPHPEAGTLEATQLAEKARKREAASEKASAQSSEALAALRKAQEEGKGVKEAQARYDAAATKSKYAFDAKEQAARDARPNTLWNIINWGVQGKPEPTTGGGF